MYVACLSAANERRCLQTVLEEPAGSVLPTALFASATLSTGQRLAQVMLVRVRHLPAGIRQWEYGRYELYRVHPPLARMAATLPLVLLGEYGPRRDWSNYQLTALGPAAATIADERRVGQACVAGLGCVDSLMRTGFAGNGLSGCGVANMARTHVVTICRWPLPTQRACGATAPGGGAMTCRARCCGKCQKVGARCLTSTCQVVS